MLNVVKVGLVLALLLGLGEIGIGCAANPDWGMRHFGRSLMGGGELRKEWNRLQMSATAASLALEPGRCWLFAYLLYGMLLATYFQFVLSENISPDPFTKAPCA